VRHRPTTGNLAVADIASGLSENLEPGEVMVYKASRENKRHLKPERFHTTSIAAYYFVGYDNAGNLFVDGRLTVRERPSSSSTPNSRPGKTR
jgi:hypothetical protein